MNIIGLILIIIGCIIFLMNIAIKDFFAGLGCVILGTFILGIGITIIICKYVLVN